MKKAIILGLILCVGLSFGETHKMQQPLSAKFQSDFRAEDPANEQVTVYGPASPIARHTSRDFSFESVLVDSSKNGYGMYSNTTSPLVWVPGSGLLAVYRQWAGLDGPSGQLGAAQSMDGSAGSWQVAVGLNYSYPNGVTPDAPMARYPSAAGTATSQPTPVWNEYTSDGSGGGENGGRAMYTYDEFGWLGGSYASPVYDLNTGCQTLPCDPPDLWVSQAQMINNGSYEVMLALFGESLGPDRYYLLRNNYYLFGFLGMSAPYLLVDIPNDGFTSGYTGGPEFHVNDNGVGYVAMSSYRHDSDTGGPVALHTFFYKKTEDYGATWTSSGGIDGSGYSYIPDDILNEIMTDAGLLGDSLYSIDENDDTTWIVLDEAFAGYDYDVKVDNDGGLHILSNMVITASDSTIWVSIEGATGQYHLYNPTPENENTWVASQVRDMSVSWNGTYVYGEFSGWQYMYPDMAMSPDGSVIWAASSVADDTSNGTYGDIDIYVSKSTDYGMTWTDYGNVTNTPSTITEDNFEMSPHFAPYATEEDAYFMFQMADFSVNTVGGTNFEDFKQRVYVGHLMDPVASTDNETQVPSNFTLSQNYPNPFNPTTSIEYSIESDGVVSIDLFDLRGTKVQTLVNEHQTTGNHALTVDGSSLASGVYFYTMNYAGQTKTKKLVLMK